MNEVKVIRRDENLYIMACNIFGNDIVKNAFITTWDYGNSKNREVEERLKKEAYTNINSEIDIGAKDIIIVFSNGKSVFFTNSEWGSIGNIDMKKNTKEA